MSRANPLGLAGLLVGLIAVFGGLAMASGGLFIDRYENDAMHLLAIVQRMGLGQVPHEDFSTPLGGLGFWPIAWLHRAGLGVGHAYLLAQILVALVLAPMVWRAASSRMGGAVAYFFAALVMVFVLALIHGEGRAGLAVSMHYNRWSWAYAFVAIALSVLPDQNPQRRPALDGAMIGLLMAALALTKVTYFAAFALPVLIGVVAHLGRAGVGAALVSGLAVAGVTTAVLGVDFWAAYLSDLLTVFRSELRAAPGLPLADVATAPAHIMGTIALLGGAILLRQGAVTLGGLLVFLLAPGFIYVTYQNFGNDPQWLPLLAVLLLTLRPESELRNGLGWRVRTGCSVLAFAALVIAAPSLINLTGSPLRHFGARAIPSVPLVRAGEGMSDLRVAEYRGKLAIGNIVLSDQLPSLRPFVPEAADPAATISTYRIGTFQGRAMARCMLQSGSERYFEAVAAMLIEGGFTGGGKILEADLLPVMPLFGPWQPLDGGAPWHYGGAPGLEDARYVLIPACTIDPASRNIMAAAVEASGVTLNERMRNDLFTLYEIAVD